MKTLYVSENKLETETLRRILKHNFKNLEFSSASSTDEVQQILLNEGPFGFFIVDAELKESDPNSLSESMVEMSGEKPFLFIGLPAAITDRISQGLYQSNTNNDQMYKPFDRDDFSDDIKNKVTTIIEWATKQEFESSIEKVNPEDFIKMKLKSFYLMNTFPYDMYLEVIPEEYIKIINANKPYSISTLDLYAKKNVKQLFIKKNDHIKYLEQETLKSIKALKKFLPSNKDYFIVLLRSITVLHQYMISLGVTESVGELVDEIADGIIKSESHYKTLIRLLKNYPQHYEGVASKSLLTGLLSVHLSKKMGWESKTTKMKLAVCSILQDYSLPDEFMSKINYPNDSRLNEFTDEEIEKFYNHPIDAANVSKQFSKYPDLDYILLNHHELPLKKGFPNQVGQSKFTVISCVFNLSQFVASELDGYKFDRNTIIQLVKMMNRDFSVGNFKTVFEALKSSFSSN